MSREARMALFLLLVLLILAVALRRAQSQEGGLPDPAESGFPSELLDLQTNYFNANDQFAQVIYAYPAPGDNAPIPLSGADAANLFIPEDVFLHAQMSDGEWPRERTWCPNDQAACPQIQAPEGVTVTVNVYESPAGHGYETVYTYRDAMGGHWRRVDNVGPETWRDSDWVFLSPLPIPVFVSPLRTPEPPQ
jgi:hypothetical protein